MSTSAFIIFKAGDVMVAHVRRHSDGYPDGPHGIQDNFAKFFDDLEEDETVPSARKMYGRVCYLAAEYVGWCHEQDSPMICSIEPDGKRGADYYYVIEQLESNEKGRPEVKMIRSYSRWLISLLP